MLQLRKAVMVAYATAGVGFLAFSGFGSAAPTRINEHAEHELAADEYGDVPSDLPPLDVPPSSDGPAAQDIVVPVVTQSGSTYTWACKNFNSYSLGEMNIITDIWGGGAPNMNREFVPDPEDPSQIVLKVKYPKGTTTPTSIYNPPDVRGGTGFYSRPIPQFITRNATTFSLEYSVYFPPEFQWVRGGKLPGLYGGTPTSRACSGGRDSNNCFSSRYMWRVNGNGEAYVYLPVAAVQDPAFCSLKPFSYCEPEFGNSIARGSFKFQLGGWTRVKMSITLNTVGKADGILSMSANGVQAMYFDKVVWRIRGDVAPQGIMFQTFFGGSTADWATPIDTYTLYKDFVMTATL